MYTSFIDYVRAVIIVTTIVVAPTGIQWIASALPERQTPSPSTKGDQPPISPLDDDATFREEETPIPPAAKSEDRDPTDQEQEPVALKSSPPNTASHSEKKPMSEVASNTAKTDEGNVPVDSDQSGDLYDSLPVADRQEFEDLLARGNALIADGVDLPSYRADVPTAQLDRILRRGLARLVVQDNGGQTFLLTGTLSQPGVPHLMWQRHTLIGYSLRTMKPQKGPAQLAMQKVSSEFNIPANRLHMVVVLRDDLDAALLASQQQAAVRLGLTLSDIAETEGSLMGTSGLPWRYRVNRVRTHDGIWHQVELRQRGLTRTGKSRQMDQVTTDLRPSRQHTKDMEIAKGGGSK